MLRTALPIGVMFLVSVFATACGGGDGSPRGVPATGDAPLVLTAGSLKIEPAPDAPWVDDLDLARLGLESVQAAYDVTTPAQEPFTFDAITRGTSNAGIVRVSCAHAADDGFAPLGGPETIAQAGVLLLGPGQGVRGDWMDAQGDGFARMTLQGRVDADQVFAVLAEADGEQTVAVVRVRVGPPSAINVAAQSGSDHPGLILEQTLYSSDSWMFGLPTLAVSGDRSSIVCYEGDRVDPFRPERYELRLQHDALTGAVTSGAAAETSPDMGNWRDHEIAALFNVLAILRGGADEVEIALSFDRGATIGQTVGLGPTPRGYRPRLVQAAMALDYTLAVLFWRTALDGASELTLVEGAPDGFDAFGSPTSYAFGTPRVLHRATGDVTPAIMGAAWSDGGDLVVGYAFTSFTTGPDRTWTSLTQNRCYTRRFGGTGVDTLVEESVLVGRDPSVAVRGSGDSLQIHYAYESPSGVRVRTSTDGGLTFGAPHDIVDPSSHMPTVIARGTGALDLLYLAHSAEGLELHVRHWEDFATGTPVDYRLTRAVMEDGGAPPPPTGAPGLLPPPWSLKITQVAWLGYDAVLDGDEIVVVYHEETVDGYDILPVFETIDGPLAAGDAALPPAPFTPAEPPPLAPGLTEPVPPIDNTHRGKLILLRIQ